MNCLVLLLWKLDGNIIGYDKECALHAIEYLPRVIFVTVPFCATPLPYKTMQALIFAGFSLKAHLLLNIGGQVEKQCNRIQFTAMSPQPIVRKKKKTESTLKKTP